MLRIDVDIKGPMFDGTASAAAARFVDAAAEEVAQEGVNLVRAQLGRVLQNPTGYYESQIQTDQLDDGWTVTDGDVIYGPWLEGVGSRNTTTRFKGYFTFRKISQRVDRLATHIAERVLPPYLNRMQ